MHPLTESIDELNSRRQLARTKYNYGAIYGIVTGLAFALAAWGIDDYELGRVHALYPWLKFMIGAAICIPLGGLAGWLSARLEKILAAVLIWLFASSILAWLITALPFQMMPTVMTWLKPDLTGLLDYRLFPEFQTRSTVAFAWAVLFGFFVGLLQIPMSESAVFSTSIFSKLAPLVTSVVLMTIAGTMLDSLNNQPLRGAITSIDSAIQFALDHRGQTVDAQTSRQMYLSAINNLGELIDRPRRLLISSYDESLGEVHVMVEFGDTLMDCLTVFQQPSFCEPVTRSAP